MDLLQSCTKSLILSLQNVTHSSHRRDIYHGMILMDAYPQQLQTHLSWLWLHHVFRSLLYDIDYVYIFIIFYSVQSFLLFTILFFAFYSMLMARVINLFCNKNAFEHSWYVNETKILSRLSLISWNQYAVHLTFPNSSGFFSCNLL